VPKEKWENFHNKAVKCIFINYGISVKGCQLWDPMVGKVWYSMNVIFIEFEPSLIVVQPEEDDKKSMVQQPPNIGKTKLEK